MLAQMCAIPTTFWLRSNTNTSNVEFIRGTPLPGENPQVSLTSVNLTSLPPPAGVPAGNNNPSPCFQSDPDSEPYFLWNADCDIRMQAVVESQAWPHPGKCGWIRARSATTAAADR